MKKPKLTRRRVLATVGAAGAAIGGAGLLTEPSLTYAETTGIEVESGTLEVEWRETYNGEVLEDTRSADFTSSGAVIMLPNDISPGDIGTLSFRLTNLSDSEVEPKLSLDLEGTAENEVIDPEAEAGDTSDGAQEGELQKFLDTKLWFDEGLMNYDVLGGNNAEYEEMVEELIIEGTLAEVTDGEMNPFSLGSLEPEEDVTVSFRWEFADDRDINKTQTDSVTFGFKLDTGGS